MNKTTASEILEKIKILKKKVSFPVVDTHVHPFDVMGVVHYSEQVLTPKEHVKKDYLKPGILESFNYSKFEKVGSRAVFKLFPDFINSNIKETFQTYSDNDLIEEMNVSLVDKSVLLPIEPWLPTDHVGKNSKNKKEFYILGSVDIHTININEIEPTISRYVKTYNIVGIKLHPNLQGFKPQPKDNSQEIAEKLKILYSTAEKLKLYLLFHGGTSNFTEHIHHEYHNVPIRSKTNALLKSFCSKDGSSELFENWSMPIIIAHIGHYGLANVDYPLIKTITEKFKNVYFDTSGIASDVIKKSIEIIPLSRLIFGSDGAYNRMAYNMAFVYLALLESVRTESEREKGLMAMLGENYFTKILNTKTI